MTPEDWQTHPPDPGIRIEPRSKSDAPGDNKDHWHADAFATAMLCAELGSRQSVWVDCQVHRTSLHALIWIYVGNNPLQHDPRFAEVKRKMGVQN